MGKTLQDVYGVHLRGCYTRQVSMQRHNKVVRQVSGKTALCNIDCKTVVFFALSVKRMRAVFERKVWSESENRESGTVRRVRFGYQVLISIDFYDFISPFTP